MADSISAVLYRWMHQRRIESEVARELEIPVPTLAAKLSSRRVGVKLAADELVPLCRAIRDIGYGEELNGILFGFVRELKGEELGNLADENLLPQILSLVRSLGYLSECADRIPRITRYDELEKIRTMLTTEVFPLVMQMENIIQSRIEALRPSMITKTPAPATDQR
jgi:hypothetical protein